MSSITGPGGDWNAFAEQKEHADAASAPRAEADREDFQSKISGLLTGNTQSLITDLATRAGAASGFASGSK